MTNQCKECLFLTKFKNKKSTKVKCGYCLYPDMTKKQILKDYCENFIPKEDFDNN